MKRMTKEERQYMLRHRKSESLVELAMMAHASVRTIERDMRSMRVPSVDEPLRNGADPVTQIDPSNAIEPPIAPPEPAPEMPMDPAEQFRREYDAARLDPSVSPERLHQMLCKYIAYCTSTPPNEHF